MPTYEDIYYYLIDNGVSPEWAEQIAERLVQVDMSQWTDSQIVQHLNQWISQAQATETMKPERGVKTRTLEVQTPTLAGEQFLDKNWLTSRLGDYGVRGDRAKDLVEQLSGIDVSTWDDRDIDRYVGEWADVAKSADYQNKMAMYQYYYNPKTGRVRSEEQSEQEAERADYMQTMTGQRPAIGGEPAVESGIGQQAISYGAVMQGRKQIEEVKREQLRQQAWERSKPQMPGYLQATQPSLEGMDIPAMKRYYERELPSLYASSGMPTAREAWWEARYGYPGKAPQFEEAREDWETALQEKRAKVGIDPWQQFLSIYPFKEKWQALSPQERGFSTSKSRPRARFLG